MKEGHPASGLPDPDDLTYVLLQMAERDFINRRGLIDEEAADAFNGTVADVRAEGRERRRAGLKLVKPKKGGER